MMLAVLQFQLLLSYSLWRKGTLNIYGSVFGKGVLFFSFMIQVLMMYFPHRWMRDERYKAPAVICCDADCA